MRTPLRTPSIIFSILALFFVAPAAFGQDKDKEWRPVTPEELSSQKPLVESDADAEAIFWEIRINDSDESDLSMKHYVRIKIYNERGRDKYSKFDVPFTKDMKIKDLAARIIKPDGSTVEIKKEDVFEREIVKTNGIKIKAKSFAVPNIEPGVIIEYKYKEVLSDAGAKGMTLEFQTDILVQKLVYYYKPYSGNPKYQAYNFTDTKFIKDKDGYWLATRTNVPAMKEEPRMPPEDSIRAWMLLTGATVAFTDISSDSYSYVIKDPSSPDRYWSGFAGEWGFLTAAMHKTNGDLKK